MKDAFTANTILDDKSQRINALLRHAAIWRASNSCMNTQINDESNHIPTGMPEIDNLLYKPGWPLGQLIECMHPPDSHAVLFPFLPALGSLSDDTHSAPQRTSSKLPNKPLGKGLIKSHTAKIVLINPPYQPYLAGWIQAADKPVDIFVVSADSLNETLWSSEHILRSNSVHAVLLWLPEKKTPQKKASAQQIDFTQLRKLQLSARQSNSLFVLFRNNTALKQASPASLRLHVYPSARVAKPLYPQSVSNQHVSNHSPLNHHLLTSNQRVASSVNGIIQPSELLHRTKYCIEVIKQKGRWSGKKTLLHWHTKLQHPYLPATQWPVYRPNDSLQPYRNAQKIKDNNSDILNHHRLLRARPS